MPTTGAQKKPLQQGKALASRTAQYRALAVGAVVLKTFAVLVELLHGDVPLVVFAQMHTPVGHRHCPHMRVHLAIGRDVLLVLITTKDIHARVRRVPDQAQYASMTEPAPDQLACPCSPVGTLRKTQATLRKALHHGVGAARFLEQAKYQLYCPAYFIVGIGNDTPLAVIAKADRQGET